MTEIKQIMETWARWTVTDDDYLSSLGYGANTLGRAMDNMPTNKCTACNGKGRIYRRDLSQFVACPNSSCDNGKVDLRATRGKINPAFIRSDPAPRHPVGDEVSETVDRVVKQHLTESERDVVYAEYVPMDTLSQTLTQAAKARRMGIGRQQYVKLLTRAHRSVSAKLFETA